MANWALPSLTSTYTNFVQEVSDRDASCAKWFDSATVSDTNLPTGTVRWNSTNKNWEKWSGATWGLLSTTYGISITGYSSHIVGGNSTTLLGAIPYQSNVNTTTLLSPNTTTTKKFLIQTGTGTNGAAPSWGTIAVGDISGAAPLDSPSFTGTPSLPTGTTGITQTVGDNTTKIATTAFVIANGTPLEGVTVPLVNGIAAVGSATKASRSDHVHPTDTGRAAINQTFYIGTTQVAINRASGVLNLAGINIDGSSGSCTGNAATASYAISAGSAGSATTATSAGYATSAGAATNATNILGASTQVYSSLTMTHNTTYTNTTGRPLLLLIPNKINTQTLHTVYVGSFAVASGNTDLKETVVVPIGITYRQIESNLNSSLSVKILS